MTTLKIGAGIIGTAVGAGIGVLLPTGIGIVVGLAIAIAVAKLFVRMSVIEIEDEEYFI